MGVQTSHLLTPMDEPLGHTAGNALEVAECVAVLKNGKAAEKADDLCSTDLKEVTIQLCAQMLVLGRVSKSLAEGRKLAHARLADGSAWRVFQEQVKAQGGDVSQILDTLLLPQAPVRFEIKARKRGFVARMDTELLGRILIELGGGRKLASDTVDPAVGLIFHRKLGAKVAAGDRLVTVHAPAAYASRDKVAELEVSLYQAIEIAAVRKPVPKLVLETI
jgi:thymidine phosphorylase